MLRFKKNLFRVFASLLMLAMLFSLAACNNTTPTSGPTSGTTTGTGTTPTTNETTAAPAKTDKTLVIALNAEPTSLSAISGTTPTLVQGIVTEVLSARLFDYDAVTGEINMNLASNVEIIDETHVRITLRQDAVYSDGTPVTAHDAAYTYLKAIEANANWAADLDPEGIEAENDHTIVVAFKRYVPGWEHTLADSNANIYSEAGIAAVGGLAATDRTPPVGCGKYNFVEWKSGEHIIVERNEDYWDDSYVGYYQYIKFIFVTDTASRVLAVRSGDADVATNLGVSDYVGLQNDSTAEGVLINTDRILSLSFNNESGIFTNAALREAAALAIDSEAINQVVNLGFGNVVQGLIHSNHPYYKEYFPGGVRQPDIEKAKQIMTDAGYPNGFECALVTTAANREVATILQESLRQAGITLEIKIMDPSAAGPELRGGNYDVAISAAIAGVLNADNFNNIDPDRVGITFGGARITDPVMSDLIAKARTPEENTARQAWSEIIDYVFDNHTMVGLIDTPAVFAVTPGLEGLGLTSRNGLVVTEIRPAN